MNDSQRVHVGGYEAWMENGMLTLHYHRVGRPDGMSMKLSPEETMGLLELLYQNRESVQHAVTIEGRDIPLHVTAPPSY